MHLSCVWNQKPLWMWTLTTDCVLPWCMQLFVPAWLLLVQSVWALEPGFHCVWWVPVIVLSSFCATIAGNAVVNVYINREKNFAFVEFRTGESIALFLAHYCFQRFLFLTVCDIALALIEGPLLVGISDVSLSLCTVRTFGAMLQSHITFWECTSSLVICNVTSVLC